MSNEPLQANSLLPPLATDDYRRLKNSIATEGQRIPILVNAQTGEVVDGFHRLQICRELGIEPRIETLDLDDKTALRLQVSLNVARRHLTPEQKLELDRKLAELGLTQLERAEIIGCTRGRISQLKNMHNVKTNIVHIPDFRVKVTPEMREQIIERVEAGKTQSQVAADFGINQGHVSRIVRQQQEREHRRQRALAPDSVTEELNVFHGDFHELGQNLASDSIDFIFTDPPYNAKWIPRYEDLAQLGARVLKSGGSLITYVGHYALPEVLALMIPHLRYWWILACQHSGSAARLQGKWVFVEWKPMLWFVKGERRDREYVADAVHSQPDKTFDDWGQSLIEARYYIERLTSPGDIILDPCCGGGTTCVAALDLGRRYIAFDSDKEKVELARKRIYAYHSHQ